MSTTSTCTIESVTERIERADRELRERMADEQHLDKLIAEVLRRKRWTIDDDALDGYLDELRDEAKEAHALADLAHEERREAYRDLIALSAA